MRPDDANVGRTPRAGFSLEWLWCGVRTEGGSVGASGLHGTEKQALGCGMMTLELQ